MPRELISKVRILRNDPTRKTRGYENYEVPYEKGARIIEVLMTLREEMGKDISYRAACRTRLCGLCGVSVNGKPILTCWDEALPKMTIDPLPNFPVLRDLVTDRSLYDKRIQEVKPYLETDAPISLLEPFTPDSFPMIKPKDNQMSIEFQQCIDCLLCVSTCPVAEGGRARFAGPAALVRLAQYAFDTRDTMQRVEIAYEQHVFDCTKCYSCEDVCPADIPIVKGIVGLEELAKKGASKKAKHAREMVKGYF